MSTVCGMSRRSDLLNPTATRGFSWKQDKAHLGKPWKAMLSLALRGVCFTAKCCFRCLLARRQEAGPDSFEGWEGDSYTPTRRQSRTSRPTSGRGTTHRGGVMSLSALDVMPPLVNTVKPVFPEV